MSEFITPGVSGCASAGVFLHLRNRCASPHLTNGLVFIITPTGSHAGNSRNGRQSVDLPRQSSIAGKHSISSQSSQNGRLSVEVSSFSMTEKDVPFPALRNGRHSVDLPGYGMTKQGAPSPAPRHPGTRGRRHSLEMLNTPQVSAACRLRNESKEEECTELAHSMDQVCSQPSDSSSGNESA